MTVTPEDILTTFQAFKDANDANLQAIKKQLPSQELENTVNALNGKISQLEAKADEAKVAARLKALEEQVVEASRIALSGGQKTSDLKDEFVAFARMADPKARIQPSDEQVKAYGEYKAHFVAKMKNPDHVMPNNVVALLSVDSQPDGGYLVPADMSGRIVQFLYETSPVRQYASVTTTSSDKLTGIYDLDEVEANWEGEGDPPSADKTPQLGRWEIPVHNLLTKPRATSNILEDASLDLEGWLVGQIAARFLRVENKAFLATAGGTDAVKRPRGLLSYTTTLNAPASTSVDAYTKFQHVKSGSTSTVNNTDFLMDLVGALKTGYQANAIFGMNRKTMTLIRKLKDGQNNYLWEPSYQLGVPPRLLGAPVVEFPDLPDIASNSLSIFYGDLGQTYQVVDRLGISVIRDNLTQWPLVDFKARKRVGGGVINFEALKFMKFEA